MIFVPEAHVTAEVLVFLRQRWKMCVEASFIGALVISVMFLMQNRRFPIQHHPVIKQCLKRGVSFVDHKTSQNRKNARSTPLLQDLRKPTIYGVFVLWVGCEAPHPQHKCVSPVLPALGRFG